MASNNDMAADQLEEVSGRWLRDQLREVSDPPEPDSLDAGPAPEASTTQLIEGLARSISAAVAEPMRGLEARREGRHQKLEETVQELSGKLGEAFVEIAKLRDQAASAAARAEEAKSEMLRAIEAVRAQSKDDAEALRSQSREELDAVQAQAKEEIEAARAQSKAEIEARSSETKNDLDAARQEARQKLDEVTAVTSDLSANFNSLAEEIGRLQGKVREQHERIDALRFRETQRAKAMNELAKASSSLREAVVAAAAMSAANEDEPAAENRG